ncbi:hypothetical protein [Amycolatopsis sp. NPDC051903]|uniref:hypothetical protein n=1 Tax=Amycolatopsis sp. NPDC051903 TaxID=3363936 RepID=UPI0037B4DBAD
MRDPALHLGESAAWELAPTGRSCGLFVLDSNANFKVGISDWSAPKDDVEGCKARAALAAQEFYLAAQPH